MTPRAPSLHELAEMARQVDLAPFLARAEELEPADLADILAALDEDDRMRVVEALPAQLSGEALLEMRDVSITQEMLTALPPARAATIVDEMADDDAADILAELDPARQAAILSDMEDRRDVERLMTYDERSAGGRMTTKVMTVPVGFTAAQALETIRRQAEDVGEFYDVYVVDDEGRLVGEVPLKELVVSAAERPVADLAKETVVSVAAEDDQETVARLLQRYNVASIPVVDGAGRLLGCVTFDDVSDVQEQEATEDILKFGGASGDEDLIASWREAVRSRLPWLYVNLLTAFVAGAVVLAFQDVVTRVVALAAWMPVIAGMGGNAGTQSLAVTVRRLALGMISAGQARRVVEKEMLVGLINGLANGVVVAIAATAIGQGPRMGLVVFLAMTGNLLVAGFAGAFIPLLLERFKVDPAIASSIFVTTFTDVCGFSLLLGLAGQLLR